MENEIAADFLYRVKIKLKIPDSPEVGRILQAQGHVVSIFFRHSEQVPPEVDPTLLYLSS
jgi:hypothetical protein